MFLHHLLRRGCLAALALSAPAQASHDIRVPRLSDVDRRLDGGLIAGHADVVGRLRRS